MNNQLLLLNMMDHIEGIYPKECVDPQTYADFLKSDSTKEIPVNLIRCMVISMNVYTHMDLIDTKKKTGFTADDLINSQFVKKNMLEFTDHCIDINKEERIEMDKKYDAELEQKKAEKAAQREKENQERQKRLEKAQKKEEKKKAQENKPGWVSPLTRRKTRKDIKIGGSKAQVKQHGDGDDDDDERKDWTTEQKRDQFKNSKKENGSSIKDLINKFNTSSQKNMPPPRPPRNKPATSKSEPNLHKPKNTNQMVRTWDMHLGRGGHKEAKLNGENTDDEEEEGHKKNGKGHGSVKNLIKKFDIRHGK